MPHKNETEKKDYMARYRESHKERIRENKRRWSTANKAKRAESNRKWAEAHPEKAEDYRQRWKKANPDRAREVNRRSRRKTATGFTQELFDSRLQDQENKCAICKVRLDQTNSHADHEHKTKQRRGVLCLHCNPMIGLAKESPEILREAANYIELWKTRYEK